MNRTARKITNFALFQVGWFACVVGATQGLGWIGPASVVVFVLVHAALAPNAGADLRMIAVVGAFGTLCEYGLAATSYESEFGPTVGPLPLWMSALWFLFASTLNSSLAWLIRFPLLAAVLGGAVGPLCYLAGERLGAVTIGDSGWFVLAIVWAVALPISTVLVRATIPASARDS